jgi:hypothetical protein
MEEWLFRCYITADGVDVIDRWYQEQPPKTQAKFDVRIRFLRQQPRSSWVRPYFDSLKGECDGLGEIRFECMNVQWRPIGFSSGRMEFTLVMVAKEKGGKFEPRSTCSVSQERKSEVENNRNRARDCQLD